MKITIVLMFLTLLFTGCSNSEIKLPIYPTTGSEYTEIWKNYDNFAKENNKPKLDFVSTSLLMDKAKLNPSDFTDIFTNENEEAYIYTKFSNVFGTPVCVIEFYTPQGHLYSRYQTQYKYNTGKWDIYSKIDIQGFPAEEISGTWKANILIDSHLAYTKEFKIQSQLVPSKLDIPYQNIGVLPFWDSEQSKRTHSMDASSYLARKLISSTNSKIIIPAILLAEISSPITNYESFLNYLREDLKSERSQLYALAKKYNLDVIITGRALDEGIVRKSKTVDVYLIDIKNKQIKELAHSTDASVTVMNSTDLAIRRALYSIVWKDFIKQINQH